MKPLARDAAVFAMLVAAAAFTWVRGQARPALEAESAVADIPLEAAGWRGEDDPVTERTYELLGTRNVLLRQYGAAGKVPVGLCLVFSREDRRVSHPPEVCYRGDGYQILDRRVVETGLRDARGASLSANRLLVERPGQRLVVLYWYKAGAAYTPNFYKQQWKALVSGGEPAEGGYALVRLSSADDGSADERLVGFARDFLPVFDEKLF